MQYENPQLKTLMSLSDNHRAYSTKPCVYWIWLEDQVRTKLILLNLNVNHFRDGQLLMSSVLNV